MSAPVLPPIGPDWQDWGRRLSAYIRRTQDKLMFKRDADVPAENGIILWDEQNKYPVVSKDGAWKQIILEDGAANLSITTDQSAASADTAYALTYTIDTASGISLGTPSSRIVFEEGGQYLLSFSAQIASSSASTVNFYFWPRVNGSDVANSSMRNALHQNGATLVVSRASLFTFSAGDYLEAMWATSSTSGTLEHNAATAFSPASPASTLAITRVKA